jgi:HSP20 family protein
MAEKTFQEQQEQRREQPADTRESERFASPPVDIFETDGGLTVVADLPGVRNQDLDIRVEEGVLTIQAQAATPAETGESLRREFALRGYHRAFQLSDKVAVDKIEAELKNGVLTLRLPKAEAAKPRRVEVKVAS